MDEQTSGKLTLDTLLARSGLNQKEFSERVGVSTSTVSAWNARKKIPRFDNAVQACVVLNCTVEEFAEALGIDLEELVGELPKAPASKPKFIDIARWLGLSRDQQSVLKQLLRTWGVNPDPSGNSEDE